MSSNGYPCPTMSTNRDTSRIFSRHGPLRERPPSDAAPAPPRWLHRHTFSCDGCFSSWQPPLLSGDLTLASGHRAPRLRSRLRVARYRTLGPLQRGPLAPMTGRGLRNARRIKVTSKITPAARTMIPAGRRAPMEASAGSVAATFTCTLTGREPSAAPASTVEPSTQ